MLTQSGGFLRQISLMVPVSVLALAGTGVLAGCSATCQNVAYDVNLSQPGADTPIGAIDKWRDDGSPGMPSPPENGWEVPEDVDEDQLTLVNPDDDWAIGVMRTQDGGWVLTSAQANCSSSLQSQAMVMPPSTAMVWPVT
jgi:hypothetical protein